MLIAIDFNIFLQFISTGDCENGLLCFQRGSTDRGPPGCDGQTEGSTDYCFDPADFAVPPDGTLGRVGNNGSPGSLFPLKACQGDCDSDLDCQEGLKCFQRKEGDTNPIPGCEGSFEASTDYCFDPANFPVPPDGTLGRVGNNGSPGSLFPLKACQGDCDSDSDCEEGLQCFQRREGDTNPIPGCEGSFEASTDYCFYPGLIPVSLPSNVPAMCFTLVFQ